MQIRRRLIYAMAAALMLPLTGAQAVAQTEERLDLATIIVGYPPGGATDSVARMVGEAMRGTYADAVVVENRPGAGGRIGAAYIKDRPADGRWLLFTPAFPMIIHPHLYDDIPYDTLTDFVPVGPTHFGVMALSVGPGAPDDIETVADFVEWARANPDEASFGGPVGGTQHFVGLMLARDADIELELIAYPGGAPSVVDVLGGHIPAVVTPLAEVLPHAQEGTLRILAVTSRERAAFAPDIPTFLELGYENIVVQDWSGFLAPAGTPADVVARANAAITAAVESESVKAAMAQLGMEASARTPEEFAEIVPESWELYRGIIEETGFQVEQ